MVGPLAVVAPVGALGGFLVSNAGVRRFRRSPEFFFVDVARRPAARHAPSRDGRGVLCESALERRARAECSGAPLEARRCRALR